MYFSITLRNAFPWLGTVGWIWLYCRKTTSNWIKHHKTMNALNIFSSRGPAMPSPPATRIQYEQIFQPFTHLTLKKDTFSAAIYLYYLLTLLSGSITWHLNPPVIAPAPPCWIYKPIWHSRAKTPLKKTSAGITDNGRWVNEGWGERVGPGRRSKRDFHCAK